MYRLNTLWCLSTLWGLKKSVLDVNVDLALQHPTHVSYNGSNRSRDNGITFFTLCRPGSLAANARVTLGRAC